MADEEETESTEDVGTTESGESSEGSETTVEEPSVSWREFASDPKLKASVEKFASLDDFIVAHNRLGGELRSRIKVPGEDSTDEDVSKYREAVGVPSDPNDYVVTEIEGYEYTDNDVDIIDDMKEWAHDNNIPAMAFNNLVKDWVQRAEEIREDYNSEIASAAQEAQDDLTVKWGNDFDKNISLAARAVHTFGGDPLVELLESAKIEGYGKLGDHPVIVEFLASIGRKTDEHDVMLTSTTVEKSSAQDRIAQIQRDNPPGTPGYNEEKVQAELRSLFSIVAGNLPIAGTSSRSV